MRTQATHACNIEIDFTIHDLLKTEASTSIPAAGTDGFFAAQVALLRAAGHWAECSAYNKYGNNQASFSFVPVSGQKPERIFEGQQRYGNVWRIEVRLYRGERVLLSLTNDAGKSATPSEWVDPADFDEATLRSWVECAVAAAKASVN